MFKSATVFVGAAITERGEELMDEIPVRGVDFDHLETGLGRTAGGGSKRIDNRADLGDGQLTRSGVAGMERESAGRDGLPSSGFRRNNAAALPRWGRAALAAGVRKLDASSGSMRAQKPRNAREGLDVLVLPDAGILAWEAAAAANPASGGAFLMSRVAATIAPYLGARAAAVILLPVSETGENLLTAIEPVLALFLGARAASRLVTSSHARSASRQVALSGGLPGRGPFLGVCFQAAASIPCR
jgi:hypothetical protein